MCAFISVPLTFWFDVLSISHQTIFEVCSSANNSITADHAALDITPENNTHTNCMNLILYQ